LKTARILDLARTRPYGSVVDPFTPIVEYFLHRGAVGWAVAVAVLAVVIVGAFAVLRERAKRKRAMPSMSQSGDGAKQVTTVSNIRNKGGDIVIAPRQTNGDDRDV
jgi:hypothetical protein